MNKLKNMFAFTNTNADISDSVAYKCLESAEKGDIKDFKRLYKELSKGSFGSEYLQKGYYRLMGYQLDFRPYLKRFLVNFKYDNSYEVIYALNKSNIYEYFGVSKSLINDILEDTRV